MSVTSIPGLVAGTWALDPVHTELGFSVRHLMVSKVRGKFASFTGAIVIAEDPLQSSATATIDLSSISTGNDQRDGHLKSQDFFAVDEHPEGTYRSTGVRAEGDHYLVDGEITLRGVTKPLTLTVELNGVGPDPYGGTRAGFTATGEINRTDFGISWNAAIEGGGLTVSEKVALHLEVEAILQKD